MMNSNVSSDDEGAHAVVNNKDEQITVNVHENGYESECSSSSRSEVDVTCSALEVEADTFTRFIERQRVEVMFELRNIRLGERPVTGQSNRERIQTFLNQIQEQQQRQPLARAPSTRPAVPSAHIADIDALANRRCVSAALGSVGFRRDLENVVRSTIEAQAVAPVRRNPQTAATQQIPHAPPIPRAFVPQNSPVNREQERPQITQTETQEPFTIERQEREIQAWQTITQLQREIIVLEISDLVHRQLVSSALESDFRTHLEQNVLLRFRQGAPPQQNQGEQQQVPVHPTPHVPTFRAPVRTTNTTRAPAVSMDDVSTRLDTMQHMLHLMFSMQMDMQRSLRQEVASAIANSASNITVSSSQPTDAGHCTVCLTAMADTVLYRCGHLCVCYMCGLNLRETTSATGVKCPICRAPVDDILRVYRSSRDGE